MSKATFEQAQSIAQLLNVPDWQDYTKQKDLEQAIKHYMISKKIKVNPCSTGNDEELD